VGESANLRILAEEISDDPQFSDCTVAVNEIAHTENSLGHGQLVEIVISVGAGIATNAIYDAIRCAVDRARDRGRIEEADSGEKPQERSASEN